MVRADMNAAFAALFSSSSGETEPQKKVAGQPWFDTGVSPAVLRVRNEANTGWIPIPVGFDPSTVYDKAETYSKQEVNNAFAALLTADRYNMVVNPAMQVSQENGQNTVSAAGAFPCDQYALSFGGTSPQAVLANIVAPSNASQTLIHGFAAAKASLAAGDYCQILQQVEGVRSARLQWGTANAKPAVLRFSAYCDVPGTYSVCILNSPSTDAEVKAWVMPFTLPDTGWKTFVIPVPAQPEAVWAKGETAGLNIRWVYACGTQYSTSVEGWQSGFGTKIAINGQTNGAAQTSKNLAIADVGLYADPRNTGKAPPFEVPDYPTTLWECRRYYERVPFTVKTTVVYQAAGYMNRKRASPSLALVAGNNYGAGIAGLAHDPTWGLRQTSAATTDADILMAANARM